SLNDLFGSVEAGTAALTLSKGKGEEYNDMLKSMQDSAGATGKAFDKMSGTTKYSMEKALNSIKISLTDIGMSLAPVLDTVAGLLDQAAGKVAEFAEWFGNLSEAQRESIVKTLAVIAAIGPAVQVFGTLTTSIGQIITVTGKFVSVLGKL